jgi:surface antigen
MPGLCNHADCGAHHAYDDWNLGFGKGKVPKVNSIMVLDNNNGLPVGHVAVVVSVHDNNNGTYRLLVQESNWDLDENIDCSVSYEFNADTLTVTRNGGRSSYTVRGFIYSDSE